MTPVSHGTDATRAVLAALLAIGLAISVGTVIATTSGMLVIGIMTLMGLVPIVYFAARRFADRTDWLLIAGWLVMLSVNLFQVTTQVPIGYLQELLLFGLGFGIVANLWRQSRTDGWLRALIFIYLAYLGLCAASTLLGRSHLLPALWQLQYNLKWPLMFGLGCMVTWNTAAATQLLRIVKYSWIILLACVVLEIAAPSIHALFFGASPDLHQNPFFGFGLRYRGPFMHSGYLAIASALLAGTALAQLMAGGSRTWALPAFVYVALLLLAGQRQELLALVVAVLVIGAIRGWQYWYLLLGVTLGAVCFGIATLIYLDFVPMASTLAQWGILDSTAPLSERAILSLQGFNVANQYWPLGSGLGTYGGAGAQKFDQSLFLDLGFQRYWWFRQGLFLVDTFWPGVLAESGFAGATLLLLMFVLLWLGLVQRALMARNTPLFATSLTAIAALTILLANSPSSGVLTDPRGSFLFWLVIGAAWHAARPKPTQESIHAR